MALITNLTVEKGGKQALHLTQILPAYRHNVEVLAIFLFSHTNTSVSQAPGIKTPLINI